MEKKYFEIISSVPLFANVDQSTIEKALREFGSSVRKYDKNEYIKHCGDPADFIGIVLKGTIHILHDNYQGNRNLIAVFSKGDMFAEAYACSGIDYLPADILAVSRTEILFINKTLLLHPCKQGCDYHHTMITNMLRIVARKNIMLNQRLRYTSHKTTGEKLLAYLNSQASMHQSREFVIPFDRQGLADYLGVDRSAMSSEISKLVKMGYIETKRSYFKLLTTEEPKE